MTPMVGGGGLPSTAMQTATVAVGGQTTATMIKRQGPGGRTVAGNALLICTKGQPCFSTLAALWSEQCDSVEMHHQLLLLAGGSLEHILFLLLCQMDAGS